MHYLRTKIAEAAAPSGGGQAPSPEEAAMMAPPPDPIEQDNQRLNNVLQNLELRRQIVEAQQVLEELTQPKRAKRRSSRDPDKPRKSPKGKPDLSTASSLEGILKNTPKMRKREAAPKAKDDKSKDQPIVGGTANREQIMNSPDSEASDSQ